MKIAYILFDRITLLDFIGIYDPISRLKSMNYIPELHWDLCAFNNPIQDNFGLKVQVNQIQNDLSIYDMIIVPGGFGTRPLQQDENFLQWLKTAEKVKYKISICTGSLLLGAAGFLKNAKATTNFQEYESLQPYCKEVIKDRIVEDGAIITAGAVAASLDLGLFLCEKFVDKQARKAIQKNMDYFPVSI